MTKQQEIFHRKYNCDWNFNKFIKMRNAPIDSKLYMWTRQKLFNVDIRKTEIKNSL
jgi:hypothetical protein